MSIFLFGFVIYTHGIKSTFLQFSFVNIYCLPNWVLGSIITQVIEGREIMKQDPPPIPHTINPTNSYFKELNINGMCSPCRSMDWLFIPSNKFSRFISISFLLVHKKGGYTLTLLYTLMMLNEQVHSSS